MKYVNLPATTLALISFFVMSAISPNNAPVTRNDGTVQQFYEKLAGEWTGSYSLWINPEAPADISEIEAEGRFVVEGSFFLFSYSWKWNGKRQEGVFLLAGEGKAASATWGDSWHMKPEPMVCEGALTEDGEKLVCLGSYETGPDTPDWGWRTEFTMQGEDAFLMEAYNITPEGLEARAVKA